MAAKGSSKKSSGKKNTAKKKNTTAKKPGKKVASSVKSRSISAGAGRSGRRTDKAPVFAVCSMALLTAVILLVNRNLNNKNIIPKNEITIKNTVQQRTADLPADEQSEKKIVIVKDKVKDNKTIIEGKEKLNEQKSVIEKEKSLIKDVNIYLVKYNEKNEKMSLAPMKRKVSSDSPLRDTLSALLKGPSAFEKKRGLLTAIPDNLKIKDVKVRNRTAVLNLNNAIEENANGNILLMRIDQLVYTATQFDDIDNIEIMVDGKLKKHFGGEGLFIDGPISRK